MASIVDRINSFGGSIGRFCSETVQWQRPVPSAIYLMIVSGLFWVAAFYLKRNIQISLLIGLSSILFILDSIKRIYQFERNRTPINSNTKVGPKQGFLAFVWLVLTKPLLYTWSWVYHRFGKLLIILLSCAGAHYLFHNENEHACWSAYTSVIMVLVTPPWKHNNVNEQISTRTVHSFRATVSFVKDCILLPICNLVHLVGRTVRYYLFLEWLAPLLDVANRKRQRLFEWSILLKGRFFAWIRTVFIDPVVGFFTSIGRFLRYWLCGHWVPALVVAIDECRRHFLATFHRLIVQPTVVVVHMTCNSVDYMLRFRWVAPLCTCIEVKIVTPVANGGRHLRHGLIYIVCGRWLAGVTGHLDSARQRTGHCVQQYVVRPLARWLLRQRKRLADFISDNVLRPAWRMLKCGFSSSLNALGRSLLAPLLRLILRVLQTLVGLFHLHVVRPVWLYFEAHIVKVRNFFIVHFGAPVLKWIVKHIPDRSPFCDDSDIELRDFLPLEKSKTRSLVPSDSDQAGEIVAKTGQSSKRAISRRLSTLSMLADDDEQQFMQGLHFPTIRNSESSDEEFDLRRKMSTVRRRKKKATVSNERRLDERNDETMQHWSESLLKMVDNLMVATPKVRKKDEETEMQPTKVDDHFEILDVDL